MTIAEIIRIVTYAVLGISSVANTISMVIAYLSCDSCKAKRLQKVAKLLNKFSEVNKK